MATTTITGRIFFAIGVYLTTSIYSVFHKDDNDNILSNNIVENDATASLLRINSKSSSSTSLPTIQKIDIEGTPDATTPSSSSKRPSTMYNYTTAAIQDRIVDLPGLSDDPGFNQFSGYIDVTPSRHIFYWYVESQSNPSKDPVVLWTNGGPGCSGLLGFGTEHGPFHVDGEGTLAPNQYSWNRIANMLYVEQPAGVGFSYFDNESDKITGDDQAANDNYQLILQFFKKFPERQGNPFYIASESYGGHYMPQLAMVILQNDFHHKLINFKGMMVGNPYVDPYTNAITQIRAYYNHGLIAKPLFDKWVRDCENPDSFNTDYCLDIEADMFDQFGPGINPYALDYPVCFEDVFLKSEQYEFDLHESNINYRADADKDHHEENHRDKTKKRRKKRSRKGHSRRRLYGRHHHHHHHNKKYDDDDHNIDDDYTIDDDYNWFDNAFENDNEDEVRTYSSQVDEFMKRNENNMISPPFLPVADNGYKPCSQVHLERFLNRHDVRLALHVVDEGGYLWTPCTDDIVYSDEDFDKSVIGEYRELIKMAIARSPNGDWINDLNILIFSGDDDSIASTAGTQNWIWDLGLPPVSHDEWKAWKVGNQTAGFVVHFLLPGKSSSSFIFATVHGAGHEVPAYRPYEALELFAKYLDRTL